MVGPGRGKGTSSQLACVHWQSPRAITHVPEQNEVFSSSTEVKLHINAEVVTVEASVHESDIQAPKPTLLAPRQFDRLPVHCCPDFRVTCSDTLGGVDLRGVAWPPKHGSLACK